MKRLDEPGLGLGLKDPGQTLRSFKVVINSWKHKPTANKSSSHHSKTVFRRLVKENL